MKEIANRLRKVRQELDLTQQQFCDKIEVSRGTFSRYESGLRSLPDEVKQKLLQFGVNLHWLLTGNGPMFLNQESTKPKTKVEANVDRLQHYIDLGKAQAHQDISLNSEDVNYRTLPITGEIAAGNPIEIRDVDLLGKILVSADIIDDIANFYCFRVNGWSMSPEVQHGDVVIINKIYDWEDLDNRIVAVRIDDGVTLKVLKLDHDNQCSWLMPINDDYKPILLNEFSTVVVLGVMEFLIRSYK